MKIICAKNDLASGVQTVYKAVSAKATTPTLSGIMIQTTEKGLRLVAYDMELGIEAHTCKHRKAGIFSFSCQVSV